MTADPRGTRHRLPRRTVLAAAPFVAAGVTAGVFLGVPALRHDSPATASSTVAVSTATVARVNLSNTTQVSGSLGYAGSYAVANQMPGTAYTALPSVGAIVRRGQRLYEVDGTPVRLFYGARPQWRALGPGPLPGQDVAQLDRNLIALGYATAAALPVSDYYTAAAGAAVARWQQATGLPVTGTVPLGQLVFAPGPLRITTVVPVLGATPQPGGQVVTATSPVPVVIAALPVTQENLAKAGDQVSVTMPDGVTTAPGIVTSVSPVASSTTASGGASSGGASAAPGGSNGAVPTVQMIVRLTHPGAAGNLDAAPVNVNVITAQAHDVLAVPVNALVALAGGGYAVEVVTGTGRHLVAVQTGLFSSTLVQVSGPGLVPGTKVEVPSA